MRTQEAPSIAACKFNNNGKDQDCEDVHPSPDSRNLAHHSRGLESVTADVSLKIGEQNRMGNPRAVLPALLLSSRLTDKHMRRSCNAHTAV